MGSPIAIGAPSTIAPPGDPRSAHVPADDRRLIDAVRGGDLHAYGTLYERHVGAARRLAARLCSNRTDVDDVVGDVFTNTLRAIRAGRGPRDDLRSYVLTATRNTVNKAQTRGDSGRALPAADDQLDVPDGADPYSCAGAIGHAFVQLPDRFRDVLWLTCVDGMAPGDVAERTSMSTGAVTSLTLRARRALARSYLVSRIEQPSLGPECASTRELLPSFVQGDAACSTAARIERHLSTCEPCRQACEQMRTVAGELRSAFPWLAAALVWMRSVLARSAAPTANCASSATAGSTIVTAIALMTFAAGDGSDPHPPTEVASTPPTVTAIAEIHQPALQVQGARDPAGVASNPMDTVAAPRDSGSHLAAEPHHGAPAIELPDRLDGAVPPAIAAIDGGVGFITTPVEPIAGAIEGTSSTVVTDPAAAIEAVVDVAAPTVLLVGDTAFVLGELVDDAVGQVTTGTGTGGLLGLDEIELVAPAVAVVTDTTDDLVHTPGLLP